MIRLFSFWRSLATYRVRIALNLKGLAPDDETDVNLMKSVQRQAAYRAVNPMMALPALIDGEAPVLFESLAIIEYLDETRPDPPLLPKDARGRARVRGLAQIVACDSHPLIVPRVREYLEHELKIDEPARMAWCRHWHSQALAALEASTSRHFRTSPVSRRRAKRSTLSPAPTRSGNRALRRHDASCSPDRISLHWRFQCLRQNIVSLAGPMKL